MTHDATSKEDKTGDQPGQRVQVLITAAGGSALPTGRAWSGTLQPGNVEQEQTDTGDESERRATDRWTCGHQAADQRDRPDRELSGAEDVHRVALLVPPENIARFSVSISAAVPEDPAPFFVAQGVVRVRERLVEAARPVCDASESVRAAACPLHADR